MTEMIVRHCAPALAGIKTGNMVNGPATEMLDWLRVMRPLLLERDMDARLVCRCRGRALLLVYRPALLSRDLAQPDVRRFLMALRYDTYDLNRCVARLRERFLTSEDFPHEVGLFLGYPLADVIGFIEHRGRNYICCGCWKVYHDEDRASWRSGGTTPARAAC